MNLHEFYIGECFDAYHYFGAHKDENGIIFRTYAPNAYKVSIIGAFNDWREEELIQDGQSGIWSFHSTSAAYGQFYKYVIYGQTGRVEHCDPYGFSMELRPGACSVITDLNAFSFTDGTWMKKRTRCHNKPMNIYELHLGSWKRKNGAWYTYEELADLLIPYLKQYGYNYVEFLPISEHPFDGSWGYQNTGFFAPTARYGSADSLKKMINKLHLAGIGVILDYVPVHFAVDWYGLRTYDGTPLYEYPYKDVGESEWGSYNFNHGRGEVSSFLCSAANYWLTEFHFDGLRMDAISRLLYWQGDESRGKNEVAIRFLKRLNQGLHKLHPTAILIAEDSTAFPYVTKDVEDQGLGFDYKWDLGWMHDTLDYVKVHPYDRKFMTRNITFSMYYNYNERYVLPLSHDEVVHMKGTIINKIYGSYEEKFAQAKVLYLYMMTHPGKKLNFMGNELAMFREWDEAREVDWNLKEFPSHDSFHFYMEKLNQLYQKNPALWELDESYDGFQWVICPEKESCLFGYIRLDSSKQKLLVLLNFSDTTQEIPKKLLGKGTLILHTDWECFGGTTKQVMKRKVPEEIEGYSGMVIRIH